MVIAGDDELGLCGNRRRDAAIAVGIGGGHGRHRERRRPLDGGDAIGERLIGGQAKKGEALGRQGPGQHLASSSSSR